MRLRGAAVGAGLIVAVLAPGTAHAVVPGANGDVTFVSDRDGNTEIYTMGADGTGQTNRTADANSDLQPTWSPDGTKIAFTSSRDGNTEIYTMNADGTGQVNRTTNAADDEHPAWSPNGTEIAFMSDRDGDREIYTMNADGTGPVVNLTTNAVHDVLAGVVSRRGDDRLRHHPGRQRRDLHDERRRHEPDAPDDERGD